MAPGTHPVSDKLFETNNLQSNLPSHALLHEAFFSNRHIYILKLRRQSLIHTEFKLAMKILFAFFTLLGLTLRSRGYEEISLKRQVEVLAPLLGGTQAEPAAKPVPLNFKVLASHTKRVYVTEAPEMPDLPSVEGLINVTVQMVEDPGLQDPPSLPPLPSSSPNDPAVLAQMEVLQEKYQETELIFVSATVYDHSRTLLHISPNGVTDGQISAWTNVDFNHFSGFSICRVTEKDGTEYDYGLLMGLGNEEALSPDSDQPKIPKLRDITVHGPSFAVIEGDTQGEAMKILTQLHDLYRKEGVRMEAAFHAREKAHAERKAYLLANPPKPKDIVIRFMERAPSKTK